MSLFASEFMVRALLGALVIGVAAPTLGIYLVQRRMSLIGDGIGHVALTGVGAGLLLHTRPVLTAVVVAAACAAGLEVLRERGRTSGDLALAVLFYGGIAGGIVLVSLSGNRSNATLMTYLFGALLTSGKDLALIAALGGGVVLVMLALRPALFAVCHDEEYARVCGLPVRSLNILLAVTTAVTVTMAMKAVGVLLISALMVIPVAAAQQVARGFRSTMAVAMAIGLAAAGCGVWLSLQANTPPGATVVVLAVAGFVAVTVGAGLWRFARQRWRPGPIRMAADPDVPDVVLER